MDFDYQILNLTDQFFVDYPKEAFPELLSKSYRPYNCLLIDTHYNDYFMCVPYRSDMRHNNGFHFSNTNRSKDHLSGLDYSKMIIVSNDDYIGTADAVVDNDEYIQTIKNINRIVESADQYVDNYIAHFTEVRPLHQNEFNRRYRYSTLKYFHKELGLANVKM